MCIKLRVSFYCLQHSVLYPCYAIFTLTMVAVPPVPHFFLFTTSLLFALTVLYVYCSTLSPGFLPSLSCSSPFIYLIFTPSILIAYSYRLRLRLYLFYFSLYLTTISFGLSVSLIVFLLRLYFCTAPPHLTFVFSQRTSPSYYFSFLFSRLPTTPCSTSLVRILIIIQWSLAFYCYTVLWIRP